jgi:polysaccharide pyruvyl transferase WcaK-like protein
MTPSSINIGLLWHSGASGNLGVGALTIGNITLARRAAARLGLTPGFTIFGTREPLAPYVEAPDIAHRIITARYLASPAGYLADVRRQHIILDIGAGDSFTDIYPDRRFAYMVATKLLALAARRPLILSPQTIGPFSRQPHCALAAGILARAAHVYARDPVSMEVAARLAPAVRLSQVNDVAFALPFTPAPRGGPVRVGLSVSGLLLAGGFAGNNEYGLGFDFGALIRRLITHWLSQPNTEVHLIAHVYAPHLPQDDDARAIDQLHAEFPGTIRAPDFRTPSEAKSHISGLDFLTGGRMHATIAAFSAGVPVVPISYSGKFEGLYAGLDYPWLVNARGMDTDTAFARIITAFEDRASLAAAIARAQPGIEAALGRYVDGLAQHFAAARR